MTDTPKHGHTEQTIQRILYEHFQKEEFKISNTYIFNWECDFFFVSKIGHMWELEIKLDRWDYTRDSKKFAKHKLLKKTFDNQDPGKSLVPHYFFYCAPEGIISKDEIPDYAGLIEITEKGAVKVRKKSLIHSKKENVRDILLVKFYKRILRLEKIISTFRIEVKKHPERLKATVKKFLNTIRF